MATSISIRSVSKRFGAGPPVLDAVDLDIAGGEFVALLGASGCGKTTLLRLVAGFETPTDGEIRFDGRTVATAGAQVPPEERNVAIVFQSYALWPHMSVGENVGYPLRVRRMAKRERALKVAEALEAVDLAGFEARRPAELSGGQRQRVALARCLAMEPGIVLLDEPLANLDVHLRASMEETFRRFHARTGATLIYVTHDQSEAMAMADRVAVMERGRLLQVDAPARLYADPRSEAVARFVGGGQVVDATVLAGDGDGRCRVRLLGTEASVRCEPGRLLSNRPGRVVLRAEDLVVGAPGGFRARVASASFKGSHTRLLVGPLDAPGLQLPVNALGPAPTVGSAVAIGLRDGWLLPDSESLPVRDTVPA